MSSTLRLHVWAHCSNCGAAPIIGPRFQCSTCALGPDINVCFSCHEDLQSGRIRHPKEAWPADAHEFVRLEGESLGRLTPWLSVRALEQPAPRVPRGFLVRPEFAAKRSSTFGGYACIVRYEQKIVALTALHVLDELRRQLKISVSQLEQEVRHARLYDVLQERWMLHLLATSGPMLALTDIAMGSTEPYVARDLAGFEIFDLSNLRPAVLASAPPKIGDCVWLAAAMDDGSRTRRAVCVESTKAVFVFRYVEPKPMPQYTSGAPILNASGEVAGINCGFGHLEDKELGNAVPLESLHTHLRGALWQGQHR